MGIFQAMFSVPSDDYVTQKKTCPGIDNIPYKAGDPDGFDRYIGQGKLKRRIKLQLMAMERGESLKMLLSASAGLGKTSFARVVAREMAKLGLIEHYFEIVAGKVRAKKNLDRLIRLIPANSFVLIDEIHGLKGASKDAMLPVLQDNLYGYDAFGETMEPLPEGISWVGATTDVGLVPEAIQRRLSVMTLEPMSFDERLVVASIQPVVVTEQAAEIMASRCFSPWEIKDELYEVCRHLTIEKKTSEIRAEHVIQACEILGIDKNGLRPDDRKVLSALLMGKRIIRKETVYRLAAGAIIAVSKIDPPTFYNRIEPKLIGMGYITVSSGGRQLTDKALRDYS